MSKERARTRQARQLEAAQSKAAAQARRTLEQAAAAKARERRARRARLWRRIRLWQHGASHSRDRERWAALVIGVLTTVLVAYLMTRSVQETLLVALVAIIAAPLLIAFVVARPRR